MSARDEILAAVRAHRPAVDVLYPVVPTYDDRVPPDLIQAFADALEKMGGELLERDEADPLAPVREKLREAKVVCSVAPEIRGDRTLTPDTHPTELADVDVGIVRAAFAVAETGSVALTDDGLVVNTLGYLPQHLIVLLDTREIVPNVHHAYRRPEWRRARYAVLQTGPSATADIEGVLIHGAQGVRSLSVALVERAIGGERATDQAPLG